MTHLLPPNLLKLFSPRPSLPYVRPVGRSLDKIRPKNVTGVAELLAEIQANNAVIDSERGARKEAKRKKREEEKITKMEEGEEGEAGGEAGGKETKVNYAEGGKRKIKHEEKGKKRKKECEKGQES